MFSGIRNFFYRHRNKFFIGGGVVGGLYLLSRYAEHKLFELHDRETRNYIEKQKRRTHYEKTRQTANATALNLSSSVTKIVSDELEIEDLLHSIRSKPANKLKLWEELKVQGFSRCVATIYSAALVGSIVHAKLMLLGGYTYGGIVRVETEKVNISSENQEKYLSHLQNFIEYGLPRLISKIRRVTERRVRTLSLEQRISLEQLETVLRDIILLLNGEESTDINSSEGTVFQLPPWSRYVAELIPLGTGVAPDYIAFHRMTEEMIDVLDSEDFSVIVQNLVQHGISHVLDYVAEFYPAVPVEKDQMISCRPKQRIPADKPPSENGVNSAPSENGVNSDERAEGTEINPKDIEKYRPNNLHSTLMKSSLPVAKLIPILTDLVHPCLSPAPGQLLQFVLLNEQLENLSFNIYEAFSAPG